jgi:hypothetical protein
MGAASSTAYKGDYIYDRALATVSSPTFTVFDANGKALPSASIEFIPEPATWLFVALGLIAL